MSRFGIVLMVLAFVVLAVVIVLPVIPPLSNSPAFDQILQVLICQPGETIQRDQYAQANNDGGTSYSMEVYCVDQEGNPHDETGRWTLIGAGGFVIPFLIGMYAWTSKSKKRTVTRSAAASDTNKDVLWHQSWATPSKQAHKTSLTQRLKELQEAHEAGLLSALEYERTRQKILDSLDD